MTSKLPPLTIRNITVHPLDLKVVERFDLAGHGIAGGGFSKITRSLSALVSSNNTTPTAAQLIQKAESFTAEEISLPIAPFSSKTTNVETNVGGTLRLTFELEGQRYRIDTPTTDEKSTVLTPLSPDPQYELTGVYLRESSFLALYSSSRLESWMSKLPSHLPLSALSIPGTHNSPTYHKALPSVRCQSVGVKFQLENGVRFLDVRVQPESHDDVSKDGLVLVHSAFPVALTGSRYFRGLVETVFSFLDANPTETVIVSVKREGIGKATDEHLSRVLYEHYASDDRRWFTENRIPTLGEVRSKIVLLRRFSIHPGLRDKNDGQGWAMDGESWPDNCADGLCTSGEIRVQDFYEVAYQQNIEKKIAFCSEHLVRAARATFPNPDDPEAAKEEAAKRPIFMNFLSASNFWRANCWPDKVAAKVNPYMVDYLCRKHHNDPETADEAVDRAQNNRQGDGSTGVVVCDWVGHNGDWDLVRCIVGMNARLETR
ncbi:PLC-like phosphodiesterase [Glarea lozoyensis ATCC 20868]|uniref:PLC-like phosphodiesterase n=1 Tax=Glarea lozoyensis (strain ATCC 20868 / MF5171) TaxID=1116229 RepID=S3CHA2_GLAL2|nr:PLC-like phosphodiesterase [Glarea lozoyensis ATCC 20868]EPE25240.1 PLC-like phosphodiesterase [Glarea lozoyensis ATCC 20868]